jgi:hypothetical protein
MADHHRSRALGPLAGAFSGGLVAVAGALVLVAGGPRRHAVAGGAAYPAVLEAVVVAARLGAPDLALAVAERWTEIEVNIAWHAAKTKSKQEM